MIIISLDSPNASIYLASRRFFGVEAAARTESIQGECRRNTLFKLWVLRALRGFVLRDLSTRLRQKASDCRTLGVRPLVPWPGRATLAGAYQRALLPVLSFAASVANSSRSEEQFRNTPVNSGIPHLTPGSFRR